MNGEGQLLFVAKLRASVAHATELMKRSGTHGIFVKPSKHSEGKLPDMALVWLDESGMTSNPLVLLSNTQAQIGTACGLCRSPRAFGIRSEPRLAGGVRATLKVQKAHTFAWNEELVPKTQFLGRGVPAALEESEVATSVYAAFNWRHVPLRRHKTTQNAQSSWVVAHSWARQQTQLNSMLGWSPLSSPSKERPEGEVNWRRDQQENVNWRNAWKTPADSSWDPWASAHASSTSAWWSKPQALAKPADEPDVWGSYKAAVAVPAPLDASKLASLEKRMDRIETSAQEGAKKVEQVETNLTTRVRQVESNLNTLGTQMQSNFDKLFIAFESRNHEDPARKVPRMDERGGLACLVKEVEVGELDLPEGAFHVGFCNAATHKGHLDRLLSFPIDLAIIGESNHVQADVRPTRKLPVGEDQWRTFNLEWTTPVRIEGDHHLAGRPSAGLVMASVHQMIAHPLAGEMLVALDAVGRCILRRVEIISGVWINIYAVYAPVANWTTGEDLNTQFITDLLEIVLSSPDELSLVIGDFNTEFDTDPITQAAQSLGKLYDLGAACVDEGCVQPPTYRTRDSSTAIDRALCSPSLMRMITGFTVCTAAGMGPHMPIIVSIALEVIKPPPLLREVLPIPQADGQVDAGEVVAWQLRSVQRFSDFDKAIAEADVDAAHFLWSTIWESYLQTITKLNLDWSRYTGRATAKEEYRVPLKVREFVQIYSEAEQDLWRLMGLLQNIRQGRHTADSKQAVAATRLHRSIAVSRSLPPLDWDNAEAQTLLEQAVRRAIHSERSRRMMVRGKEWKSALNRCKGSNALARRAVRGASARLCLLKKEEKYTTCPRVQCSWLNDTWSEISQGTADKPLHEDVLPNVKWAPCVLPLICAADVEQQLKKTRAGAAHGPDWWRVAELRRLPPAALAMLATLFNTMEAACKMPRALTRGWTCAVPKDANTATPEGIRPITILSLLHRTWAGIRYQHVQGWIEATLADGQSAYRNGRSTKLELHSMLDLINAQVRSNKPVFIAQLDLAKAFPKLNKDKACLAASLAGMPAPMVQYIRTSCLGKLLKWKINGVLSSERCARRGTPQGCAVSILMFQLQLSPIIRAVENKLRLKCVASKVYAYADDIVFVMSSASPLTEIMAYTADLLQSLDLQINVLKSSVSMIGTFEVPRVVLGGQVVPVISNPNLFGSTLATTTFRLPPPSALPHHSASRTINRWKKVRDRLNRLVRLALPMEAKAMLWRAVILPVAQYDMWTLLPNKLTAESWTRLITKSVFTAIRGPKDKYLLACANPHQMELVSMMAHQLAAECIDSVWGEPLCDFFVRSERLLSRLVQHSFECDGVFASDARF
eukprot:6487087-Amphidinium_carterae.3